MLRKIGFWSLALVLLLLFLFHFYNWNKGKSADNISFTGPAAFLAAAEGDTWQLEWLLREGGVDPDKLETVVFGDWPEKTTLLIIAIGYRQFGSIDLLLDYQADPNLTDDKGYVALDYAAMLDKSGDITKFLLERGKANGIDPNHREIRSGMTPLLNAALLSNYKAAELLLEAGADPNAEATNGVTPLAYAKQKPYPELIELLKRYGAKEEAKAEPEAMAETKAKE